MTPEDRISNLISANIQAERELRQMQELHNKELAMMRDRLRELTEMMDTLREKLRTHI